MRTQRENPARTAWLIVAGLLAIMLLFAGCGSSDDDSTGNELQIARPRRG